MISKLMKRGLNKEPAAPSTPIPTSFRHRMSRNNETPTEAIEEEGGFITRAIKKRRAKTKETAKQKALDDGAFFGMRSDGTMVDGWPIK